MDDNEIDVDIVNELRGSHLRWNDVAAALGICRKKLYRWRQRTNYADPCAQTELSDDQLDHEVRQYIHSNEKRGIVMTIGYLKGIGLHLPRRRVRESIKRVDPSGGPARKAPPIPPVQYQSPGPHFVWPIDGNHKLFKKWGLVIHGGIDGFSRMVVFLQCSTRNTAKTVYNTFLDAVAQYGIPSHIRCDYGGENYEAARFMLEERGLNRGSVLTGRSAQLLVDALKDRVHRKE